MIHRLHRKAACAFMAVTTAAAMIFPVGAATIYFDVSPNDWYYDAVEYGVTTGLLADTIGDFHPNQAATRAMLYTMLHRAAGSPKGQGQLPPDVSANAWYAETVRWAVGEGLWSPMVSFGAEQTLTRAELCTALLSYDQATGGNRLPMSASNTFTDLGGLSTNAQAAVSLCRAAGIVSGRSATTFAPSDPMTRAELVTAMQRYFIQRGQTMLAFRYDGMGDLLDVSGWTGNVQLDFPLSTVDTVTEELVVSLNQRMLQENTPKVTAGIGKTIDGDQKHLTNYGSSIYDCYGIRTILSNSKNNVGAGVALSGKQEYYGYALQVSDTLIQDTWHQMAEATGKDPWQCTWWAWGRAAQYVELAHGQSLVALCDGVTLLGNGGDYYRTLSPYFQGSTTVPKANSIVSWSGGQYGHVGYVEAVDDGGIWVSMADAGHAWRGVTYIPKSNNPNNRYPLHWYGESERCNGFIYLDYPK